MKKYTLQEMLLRLMNEPDELFGRFIFSYEILRNKLDQEQIVDLIKRADECGREYSEKFLIEAGMKKGNALMSETVARQLNLRVEYCQQDYSHGENFVFGQYHSGKIDIFSKYIQRARKVIEQQSLSAEFGQLPLAEAILAHEVFHYLEEIYYDEIFTKQYKIDLWAPRPFKNRSTISCLGEIAATAFAKNLIGVEYSPLIFDFLIGYSIDEALGYQLYSDMLNS